MSLWYFRSHILFLYSGVRVVNLKTSRIAAVNTSRCHYNSCFVSIERFLFIFTTSTIPYHTIITINIQFLVRKSISYACTQNILYNNNALFINNGFVNNIFNLAGVYFIFYLFFIFHTCCTMIKVRAMEINKYCVYNVSLQVISKYYVDFDYSIVYFINAHYAIQFNI